MLAAAVAAVAKAVGLGDSLPVEHSARAKHLSDRTAAIRDRAESEARSHEVAALASRERAAAAVADLERSASECEPKLSAAIAKDLLPALDQAAAAWRVEPSRANSRAAVRAIQAIAERTQRELGQPMGARLLISSMALALSAPPSDRDDESGGSPELGASLLDHLKWSNATLQAGGHAVNAAIAGRDLAVIHELLLRLESELLASAVAHGPASADQLERFEALRSRSTNALMMAAHEECHARHGARDRAEMLAAYVPDPSRVREVSTYRPSAQPRPPGGAFGSPEPAPGLAMSDEIRY